MGYIFATMIRMIVPAGLVAAISAGALLVQGSTPSHLSRSGPHVSSVSDRRVLMTLLRTGRTSAIYQIQNSFPKFFSLAVTCKPTQ